MKRIEEEWDIQQNNAKLASIVLLAEHHLW